MGLSHTVSEIDGDFSQKLYNFLTAHIFCSCWRSSLEKLGIGARDRKNGMIGLLEGPKSLDTIPACDRQRDIQTCSNTNSRAMLRVVRAISRMLEHHKIKRSQNTGKWTNSKSNHIYWILAAM